MQLSAMTAAAENVARGKSPCDEVVRTRAAETEADNSERASTDSDSTTLPSSKPSKKARVSPTANSASRTTPHFPAELLLDLAGSTSAEVRRMNEEERALVHYKRRLRNRESAKRSRARRQATINDIQLEIEHLKQATASLLDTCVAFAKVNSRQAQELETVRKEKNLLETMLRSGADSAP